MRTLTVLSLVVAAGLVPHVMAQTPADLNEGLRTEKQTAPGAYSLRWWGKTGRSYFVQQSTDLVSWTYAPLVFSGDGVVAGLGFTTSAERQFWRLRHTDAQTAGNVLTADFDNDGVGNQVELDAGLDPFASSDANSNGLPDDWEVVEAGKFAPYPPVVNVSVAQGASTTRSLTLRNDTAQAVEWSLAPTANQASLWENSNTGGPAFNWEEISSTGTLLTVVSNSSYLNQEVTLTGFSFPFLGQSYSTFQVNPTGYIAFASGLSQDLNRALPNEYMPRPMLAAFWDDLNPAKGGDVYFQEFTGYCIIEYKNVEHTNSSGSLTFQIVLFADGTVEMRYHTLTASTTSCTVGYQNGDSTIAETLVHNEPYLTSNTLLRWRRGSFFTASPASGTVPAHSSASVTLDVNALYLPASSQSRPPLVLTHDGAGSSPASIPVTVTIPGPDTDADGLPDSYEVAYGLNPALADDTADRDLDGLTNYQEYLLGTVPDQPDTDDDGMNDGWETRYGFPALVHNASDADATNDLTADPDGDGLLNSLEEQLGTDPRSSDTDGDTYTDATENTGESNPGGFASTPPNPGGNPGGASAPPPPTVAVQVQFGDHSASHSEKYKVFLEPLEGDPNPQKRSRSTQQYGQIKTETFNLPAGAKYKITLEHTGSDPKYKDTPKPDFDYTLNFSYTGPPAPYNVVTQDPQNVLGVHNESTSFFAKNKSATLNVAWLTSEAVATLPQNRKRTKVGVGEEVYLNVIPASLPAPSWEPLAGNVGTSQLTVFSSLTRKLVAGERKCEPQVVAKINGAAVELTFDVVEPSGVQILPEPGTGVWHVQGKASAGFKGRPYILPNDVSFVGIEIKEDTIPGTGTGYFNGDTSPHPAGQWHGVALGDAAKPSKVVGVDTINSNPNDPPFSPGTFEWQIPWLFKVNGGAEKEFTRVLQKEEMDSTGGLTISKGGHSVSRAASDPTSNF